MDANADEISDKTLKMMDKSIANLKKGKDSKAVDFDKYINSAII